MAAAPALLCRDGPEECLVVEEEEEREERGEEEKISEEVIEGEW